MNHHIKTVDAAIRNWRGILLELGVPSSALSGKHGPCPICGGKDRFRYDNKEGRGTWICSVCGAGDGMRLACEFTGQTFADTARQIDRIIGNLKPGSDAPKPEMDGEAIRRAIRETAALCQPVEADDLVARYLASRGIRPKVYPSSLRFAPRLRDGEGGVRPAMVASVKDRDGNTVTLHRTFLKPDGAGKAEMGAPRKLMPGPLPDGACVRLTDRPCRTLGVAEGIETALAAMMQFRVPVWAAVNSALMKKWWPPEGVERVIVFGDNDPKCGGQAAAWTLAHRLAVRDMAVEVRIPDRIGADWADMVPV